MNGLIKMSYVRNFGNTIILIENLASISRFSQLNVQMIMTGSKKPVKEFKIREFMTYDSDGINRVIKSLHPTWFDNEALKNIPIDIHFQKCFVAEYKAHVIGFISFFSSHGRVEINWIGVKHNFHRIGIGRKLVSRVEEKCINFGINSLYVETVGWCTPKNKLYNKSYGKTIEFYKAIGFEVEKKGVIIEEMGYKYRIDTFKKEISPRTII